MCNTVGELIEELKEFDPSTPLDLTAFCYADADNQKWVQIERDRWRMDDPKYEKPLNIFVEEHTYNGKTKFCCLSADSEQMRYDGPNFADDD